MTQLNDDEIISPGDQPTRGDKVEYIVTRSHAITDSEAARTHYKLQPQTYIDKKYENLLNHNQWLAAWRQENLETPLSRDEKIDFIMKSAGVAPHDFEASRANYAALPDNEIDKKCEKFVGHDAWIDEWRRTRGTATPRSPVAPRHGLH